MTSSARRRRETRGRCDAFDPWSGRRLRHLWHPHPRCPLWLVRTTEISFFFPSLSPLVCWLVRGAGVWPFHRLVKNRTAPWHSSHCPSFPFINVFHRSQKGKRWLISFMCVFFEAYALSRLHLLPVGLSLLSPFCIFGSLVRSAIHKTGLTFCQEQAKDWLAQNEPSAVVVGGYLSPVSDAYGKKVRLV